MIPKKDECPIDVWMNDIADKLSPTFHKLSLTPNQITTISLIFGLLAVLALWKRYIFAFAFFYIISYFFDCMDGHYARKYGMTSNIGDFYDHSKDILIGILILYVLLKNYTCSIKTTIIFAIILGVFAVLLGMFVGCQAILYKDGDSVNLLKKTCPGNNKEEYLQSIQKLKYFGTGTFTLVLILVVVFVTKMSNK